MNDFHVVCGDSQGYVFRFVKCPAGVAGFALLPAEQSGAFHCNLFRCSGFVEEQDKTLSIMFQHQQVRVGDLFGYRKFVIALSVIEKILVFRNDARCLSDIILDFTC